MPGDEAGTPLSLPTNDSGTPQCLCVYRQRMRGTRNKEGGKEGDGELQLPHKTKITYNRAPLKLQWADSAPDTE